MRVTCLHGRTRVIPFLFVAVGIIALTYGMLYIFEGMEAEQGGIPTPIDEHLHHTPADTVVNARPEVIVTSSTTSTISPTLSSGRPDLPERVLTQYVNPLIGTEGFGHCTNPCIFFLTVAFAGATIPFGMAKAVPDSDREWQNQAGFLHDNSRIKGISQLHDEGTGGTGSLGNFPIWMDECKSRDAGPFCAAIYEMPPRTGGKPNLAARSGPPPNTVMRAMPVGVTVRTPSP